MTKKKRMDQRNVNVGPEVHRELKGLADHFGWTLTRLVGRWCELLTHAPPDMRQVLLGLWPESRRDEAKKIIQDNLALLIDRHVDADLIVGFAATEKPQRKTPA